MGKNQRLTITRPCRDIHINGQRRDTEERRAPTQRRIQRHQPTQGKLMGVDRLLIIVVYLRRRIQLGTQHDTRTRSNKSKYSTETIVEDTTGRRLLWGGWSCSSEVDERECSERRMREETDDLRFSFHYIPCHHILGEESNRCEGTTTGTSKGRGMLRNEDWLGDGIWTCMGFKDIGKKETCEV